MSHFPNNRRSFLCALASVPGLRLLVPAPQAAAQEISQARDVIQELGVRSFINAAGTFTFMTGSLMPPEVMAAIQVASRKYVRLEELHDAVGRSIA
ncbi:MAG: selenocysteine synthase, partial [Planctomycetes bacterium]|nr:selenocysteine synthase [Planctomycetota bacterium]